ncbi:class I SAM-dependent methyltransferase [Nitrososphaera viennensis]|uniref:Class I SAM-dependent methyltransferase n=1 Tax=Nitrososphaera viennensis TaxID=1034015 RepID=A0A977IBH5_9ARCH|nr:class I SAM-dependent methyltransferase [Nitrososphaera viennensis]UVS67766.1 class I SAM-dependent methyltransferase [Nitrososphaera viennensis]
MADFKDLFSKQSKEYAASRPTYPRALFEFLAVLVGRRELAWDCATGNGQAAALLAGYFKQVVASDASKKQIENARAGPNVRFAVFPAEKPDLADNSVDLITVAQALHWFRFDDFYREVRRVARKDAVIAAWTYGLHSVSPEVDKVTQTFYKDIVGRYWPPEVRYVENRYENIPFPFPQVETPDLKIELEWDMQNLVGYLYSWSSTQKYIEENKSDPVKMIYPELEAAWGKENAQRKVTWPIYMKAGRLWGERGR